jgi:two-component system response regulator AtoC
LSFREDHLVQKTHLLLIGNRAEMASLAEPISNQFPDIACQHAAHVAESLEQLSTAATDLVLFHWRSRGDRSSFDALMKLVRTERRRIPVIVLSEVLDSDVVLHTLQSGAVDCLSRPFNTARLVFLTGTCTARAACGQDKPSAAAKSKDDGPVFLPSSTMRDLMESLQMAARSDSTILLMGETGTGKNRLATFAHQLSARRHEPFVTVDCGASSETLIESELFGHMRGAFTGADREHQGKLERAGQGTVLLDEVDCLPQRCQTRLLRVLEERVFEKVGGEKAQKFSGRVVALTNQALHEQVAEGRFRKDLYYRLNVIAFTVPPLRDRPHDIAPLTRHFLRKLSAAQARQIEISDHALGMLSHHDWPGNVRELRNVVERAIALCDADVIEPKHLHLPRAAASYVALPENTDTRRLASVRKEAERRELVRILEANNNNRTRAAQNLGISRSALYKRLEVLGLG